MGRFRNLWPAACAVLVLLVVACSPTVVVGRPPGQGPAFPRTAAVYLAQDSLPPAAELAKKNLVVIDSEWAHRMPNTYFAEVRAMNPHIVLLAYVNIVDRPDDIGTRLNWSDRYALWQFDDAGRSGFPRAWLAHTAEGAPVSEYPGTTMTNLADTAPTVRGMTFGEYAVNWMVSTVWSSGVWSGLFLDAWGDRIFTADRSAWDVDGKGRDVPDSLIYGGGKPWERGITRVEEQLRARLPTAILVANGDRTPQNDLLDGLVYESFADQALAQRDPGLDLQRYLASGTDPQLRTPGVSITLDRRPTDGPMTADDQRRARFFLTMTLLQNGYWASMGSDYDTIASYDELDGGGRGPGYLGSAVLPDPTPAQVDAPFANGEGQLMPGVFRRDFVNGIAVVNTGDAPVVVPLGARFIRLRGTGDPVVNDGAPATTIMLQGHDGIVLMRG